jgi:Ulp1 family protease
VLLLLILKSTKRGSHWFAIFIPRTGPIEYFDSFGFKPQNKEVYHFIKMNGKQWIYNSMQIQSNESDTCGLFCIIFIALRSRNHSFKQFPRMFKENKFLNENLIRKLFFRFFSKI